MSDTNYGPINLSDLRYALAADLEQAAHVTGGDHPDGLRIDDIDLITYWYHDANDTGTEVTLRLIATCRYGTKWAYIAAWNDYTGWDCQDGVTIRYADTFDDLVRLGLEREDRARWGLLLPDDGTQR